MSKNRLSNLYYSIAKAYRKEDFEYFMAKVGKVYHYVKDYIYDVGYETWVQVYAPINIGRMMTSDIVECINGCLMKAREFPILEFSKQV